MSKKKTKQALSLAGNIFKLEKLKWKDYQTLEGDKSFKDLICQQFNGEITNSNEIKNLFECAKQYVLSDVLQISYYEFKELVNVHIKDIELEENFEKFMSSDSYIVFSITGKNGTGKSSFLK